MTMPAPEEYFEQLREALRNEDDPKIRDLLLDKWLETSTMATEWDAVQWGFDTERWMREERDVLARRAARDKVIDKSPGPDI